MSKSVFNPVSRIGSIPDHVEVLASGGLARATGPVIVNGRVVGR
jgi:hypothetical protein